MARVLLLNSRESEETRAALVEDGRVLAYRCDRTGGRRLSGNVYKGRIVNLEPAIGACFVDVGVGRNGFLHKSDWPTGQSEPFEECFAVGSEVVVQVTREIIGSKGPVLSGNIGLPGRFLVLLPYSREGGVSRRIEDDDDRQKLRAMARTFENETGHGFILRTAAADRDETELRRDLEQLERLWQDITTKSADASAPHALYADGDLVGRAVRDLVDPSVETIWVDTPEALESARASASRIQPDLAERLRLHEDAIPLFHAHGVEASVDRLRSRRVGLPSGGSLVFDRTEALVAIDVNSGRLRDSDRLEETALRTNLEAATEIARQVRLRDLGGVIVVDFIDMLEPDNVTALDRALRGALAGDQARVRTGGLGAFGLFTMTRRRASAGGVARRRACGACAGTGEVALPEEVALRVFRELCARAAPGGKNLLARVGPDVAALLESEFGTSLRALEADLGGALQVEPADAMVAGSWEVVDGA